MRDPEAPFATSTEPRTKCTAAHVLNLPVEIRRLIILEVLLSIRRAPKLTPKLIQNRVRLRNRFDAYQPTDTNIYVPKTRPKRINGNALLGTNRQLRIEALDLIDTLKRGGADMPFVLDVMVVKDVGILPTWRSFPFMPTRIKKLQIGVRIFRAEKVLLPADWITAGQFLKVADDPHGVNRTSWNFVVLFCLYAMGQLSLSPAKSGETFAAAEETVDLFDAEVTSAPYAVDKMFIDWHSREYFANGKVIFPFQEEIVDYYKEGYVAFARGIFNQPLLDDGDGYIQELISSGKVACHHLSDWIWSAIYDVTRCLDSVMEMYFDSLVNNVGVVKDSGFDDVERYMIGHGDVRYEESWALILTAEYDFIFDNVVRDLAIEEEKVVPDERALRALKHVKRRIDLGWWNHEEYTTLKAATYPDGTS